VVWNDNYVREVERTVGQRVQAAAFHVLSRWRENVSIPSRTVTMTTITRGKNKGKTKKVLGARGSNRSKPGQFYHKDFGTLRQSGATDYDPATLTARIGSPMAVAKWLELGTKNIRPRKGFRATLIEESPKVTDMIRYGTK
jgi:hypothetical protein